MTQHVKNPTLYNPQEILNESFNDAYKILIVGSYGYDTVSDSFKPGQAKIAYDYVSLSQASTADSYTFKQGGSGGTTVSTVTINYTDSTKSTLSNVTRT